MPLSANVSLSILYIVTLPKCPLFARKSTPWLDIKFLFGPEIVQLPYRMCERNREFTGSGEGEISIGFQGPLGFSAPSSLDIISSRPVPSFVGFILFSIDIKMTFPLWLFL